MSDKKDWFEAIAREDRKDLRDEKAKIASLPKKTVWLNVSIELAYEDHVDEESLMDYAAELAYDAGFTVDDMGMIDPSDKEKFYEQ